MEEWKENGIIDKIGETASAIDQSLPKYVRGRRVLEDLVGSLSISLLLVMEHSVLRWKLY